MTSGIGGWLFGALLALMLVGYAGRAGAQDGADGEARGLFLAGQAAFEAARYEDALSYFRRAHERSARPEMLYNIALAADRLRRDEEALRAFEGYLAGTGPESAQRRDVEARIAVLREAIAADEARAPVDEHDDLAPIDEARPDLTVVRRDGDDARVVGGWSLVGAGSAVAIAGAVVLGLGRAEAARVETAVPGTPWLEVAGSAANAEWMSPVGIALMAVGAAAALGGALWLGLGGPAETADVQVGLGLGGLHVSGAM